MFPGSGLFCIGCCSICVILVFRMKCGIRISNGVSCFFFVFFFVYRCVIFYTF